MENMNISLDETLQDHFNVQMQVGPRTLSVVFKKINGRFVYWETKIFDDIQMRAHNSDFAEYAEQIFGE